MSGKIIQAAVSIMIPCFYTNSGIGVGSLTVTVDIGRYRGGAWASVISGGSATAATGVTGGYGYLLDPSHIAAGDVFVGKFITAGTVDQKELPFMFRVEDNYTVTVAGRIDAAISTRSILTAADVTAATAPLATTADLTLVYNRLGAPAGASMSADVAAVKADTASVLTNVAALPAAIWDRLLTSITTVGSIGKRIKDYLDVQLSTIPALTATALRAVVVTFRTPVESEGKINIRAGDDYTTGVYDRAFVWELTNLPELVGGTASMVVDGVELTTTGTVTDGGVNGDGDTVQIVTVEVTAAQSALLVSDNWGQRKLFSVQITQGGELMTEISGTANVYPPHA